MAVDSYLELFTTLFGWRWYGIIWDALTDTGIVYIPFVMILLTLLEGRGPRRQLWQCPRYRAPQHR